MTIAITMTPNAITTMTHNAIHSASIAASHAAARTRGTHLHSLSRGDSDSADQRSTGVSPVWERETSAPLLMAETAMPRSGVSPMETRGFDPQRNTSNPACVFSSTTATTTDKIVCATIAGVPPVPRCGPVSHTLTTPRLTSPLLTSPRLTTPRLTFPLLTSPLLTSPRRTSLRLTSPRLASPFLTAPRAFLAAAAALVTAAWPSAPLAAVDLSSGANIGAGSSPNPTYLSSGNTINILDDTVRWTPSPASEATNGKTINADTANRNYTLTIQGNGHTINAGGRGRWFYIDGNTTNATITINNAIIKGNNYATGNYVEGGLFWKRSGSGDAILNLEGTTIQDYRLTTQLDSWMASGPVIVAHEGTGKVIVNGGTLGVTFKNNTGARDSSGAVMAYRASMDFNGKVTFDSNGTANYGGGMTVNGTANADIRVNFYGETTFVGNHAELFGGAFDVWGGGDGYTNRGSTTTFHNTVTFENNYVWDDPNVATDSGTNYSWPNAARRGGAMNMGYIAGQADVVFNETATFIGNHVIAVNSNTYYDAGAGANRYGGKDALGGALSAFDNRTGNGRYYYTFNKGGVFENNYVYAPYVGTEPHDSALDNRHGRGYGGAIFLDSSATVLTLGSGSRFVENYASVLGGAIYIYSGTIKLNSSPISTGSSTNITTVGGRVVTVLPGDIYFNGNLHGVPFSPGATAHDFIPDTTSALASPNAIYFGTSGTLDINAAAGSTVHFFDPLASSSGSGVTLNKNGVGDVVFYTYDSPVSMTTNVNDGYFRLYDGVNYGVTSGGTFTATGNNTTQAGIMTGSDGSWLRAQTVNLRDGGRAEVESATGHSGLFQIQVGSGGFHLRDNGGLGGNGIMDVRDSANNITNIQAYGRFVINANDPLDHTQDAAAIFQLNSSLANRSGSVGSLNKTGLGTFLVTRSNTYTGGNRIDAGTIELDYTHSTSALYSPAGTAKSSSTALGTDAASSKGLIVNDGGKLLIHLDAATSSNYILNNALAARSTVSADPSAQAVTNTGTGLIDIDLAAAPVQPDSAGGAPGSRPTLTLTPSGSLTTNYNYNARLLLQNLDYTMLAGTSATSVPAAISKTHLEVGNGARIMLPSGTTYLGAFAFAADTSPAILRIANVGTANVGQIGQRANSVIDARGDGGVLDTRGKGIIQVAQDDNMSNVNSDLNSLFTLNNMPLLLRDDYGLPRVLIQATSSITRDTSNLSLQNYNGVPINVTGTANLEQNNDALGLRPVAIQQLRINDASLTTGPLNDGLYIGAHLERLDLIDDRVTLLSPNNPSSTTYPATVPGSYDFKVQITDDTTLPVGTTRGRLDVSAGTGNTLTLGGTGVAPNTYTGATHILTGTLRGGQANIVATSSQLTVDAGTTFDTGPFDQTANRVTGGGTLHAQDGTTLTLNNPTTADATTFTGALTSTGTAATYAKTGAGTLTLTGTANTHNSAWSITGGTLAVTGTLGPSANYSGNATLTGTGELAFTATNPAYAQTLSGTTHVSNNAQITFNTAAPATLTGTTHLSDNAKLTFNSTASTASATLTGTINVSTNAQVIFNTAAPVTLPNTGTIAGTGTVSHTGTGLLTVHGTISAPFTLGSGSTLMGEGTLSNATLAPTGTGTGALPTTIIVGNDYTVPPPPTLAPGASVIETLTFGNASGTTVFDGVTLKLDIAPTNAQSAGSDLIHVLGNATFGGQNVLDINSLTVASGGTWVDGDYTFMQATGGTIAVDPANIDSVSGAITSTINLIGTTGSARTKGYLTYGADDTSLVLHITSGSVILYWDGTDTSGTSTDTDIWNTTTSNTTWRPTTGGTIAPNATGNIDFQNGDIVFFSDNAVHNPSQATPARTADVAPGGVTVGGMVIANGTGRIFTGGKITGDSYVTLPKAPAWATGDPVDILRIGEGANVHFRNEGIAFPEMLIHGDVTLGGGTGTTTLEMTEQKDNTGVGTGIRVPARVHEGGSLTVVDGGDLSDGNSSGLGTRWANVDLGPRTITDASGTRDGRGTLAFNRATTAYTYGGVISGAGHVVQRGAATVTLSGDNTYTGDTAVNAGELRITGGLGTRYDDALNPGRITERNYVGDILLAAGGTLRFNGPDLVGPGGIRIGQQLSGRIAGAAGSKFVVDGGRNVLISSDWDNTPTQYPVSGHNNFLGDLWVEGTNAGTGNGSTLRITGRLDVQTEHFDGNLPWASRAYTQSNYHGNMHVANGGTLEFAYSRDWQVTTGTLTGSGGYFNVASGQHFYFMGDAPTYAGTTTVTNGSHFHISPHSSTATYGASNAPDPALGAREFRVETGSSLHGGGGAVLNASNLLMEPGTTLSVAPGGFSIHIAEATMANVKIADTIHIIIDAGKGVPVGTSDGIAAGASVGKGALTFADASGAVFPANGGVLLPGTGGQPGTTKLTVGTWGYIPLDMSMEYVLIDGLNTTAIASGNTYDEGKIAAAALFGNGGRIELLGAQFQLSFYAGKLVMTQASLSSTIPEPSTYALLGGLGVLGLAFWRRRRGKCAGEGKSAAAGVGA